MVLKCEYSSIDTDRITLVRATLSFQRESMLCMNLIPALQGGESTLEEMCLTFLTYYPRPAGSNILTQCLSFPQQSTYLADFISFLQGSR